MLDRVLTFTVVIGPTLFAIAVEVMAESVRKHRFWKWGVMGFGLLLSGLTWWQISRQETNAATELRNTVEKVATETSREVSETVTQTVTAQYTNIVNNLTDQIGILKGQLAEQGKKVDVISSSNIVTGKKPLKVEVLNPSPVIDSGEKPPGVSWTQKEAAPQGGRAITEVDFRVEDSLEIPAFIAVCDRPCATLTAFATGASQASPIFGHNSPNVAGFVFVTPRPLGRGVDCVLDLASSDSIPVNVTQFRVLKKSEIPIEAR